jgi:hypothetical protein
MVDGVAADRLLNGPAAPLAYVSVPLSDDAAFE